MNQVASETRKVKTVKWDKDPYFQDAVENIDMKIDATPGQLVSNDGNNTKNFEFEPPISSEKL